MPLDWRPEKERVRIVYSSGPQAAFPNHKDAVFAVIGPLNDFADKHDLQQMIETLLRGWNIEKTE